MFTPVAKEYLCAMIVIYTMNKAMTNDKALNEYLKLQVEVLMKLELLKEKIESCHDTSPEEIHYGHVGDLSHISKVLENLINPI